NRALSLPVLFIMQTPFRRASTAAVALHLWGHHSKPKSVIENGCKDRLIRSTSHSPRNLVIAGLIEPSPILRAAQRCNLDLISTLRRQPMQWIIDGMNARSAEQQARASLLERYPEYADTAAIDELRLREYSRLDEQQQVYLDYTGGALYAESQIRQHAQLLATHVLGNPHSGSLSSVTTTGLVEQARRAVPAHFNSARDYVAI